MSYLLRLKFGLSLVRYSIRGGVCRLANKQNPKCRNYATATTPVKDDKQSKKFTSQDESAIIARLRATFDNDEHCGDVVPIYKKALLHANKVAIKDQIGEYTYSRLYAGAKKLSLQISNLCGSASSAHIAFLCPNDALYAMVQWSCWFSGQVAVPLSSRHPQELLRYFIEDSKSSLLITTPEFEALMKPIAERLGKMLIIIDHTFIPDVDPQVSYLDPKMGNILQFNHQIMIEGTLNNDFYTKSNAMILYTSGTTGSPKGVVLTHKNVNSQVNILTDAWQFSPKDCLLHVLPLNHVHGCLNALMCPLSVGAKVIMHEHYDSHNVWSALLGINTPAKDRVNVFMAVPTIYNFLIDEYEKIFAKNTRMVEYIENHCKKNIRLMVSGSAPLPVSVFNRWFEISTHRLLERYGMTEIGMALSNPYIEDGKRARRPGTVGVPLPDVEVRIVDAENKTLVTAKGEKNKGYWGAVDAPIYEENNKNENKNNNTVGELQVKGPNVFKEYYNRPEETVKEFTDGYFKTGDVASFDNGIFKILGRSSIDIIKTGGYKVSALEIETHLLSHPDIKDIVIVGIEDITWGQKIAAVCSLRNNTEMDIESLKVFCSDKMATYQMPTILKIVDEIPRNAMGKVNKKDIIKQYFTVSSDQLEPTKPQDNNDTESPVIDENKVKE